MINATQHYICFLDFEINDEYLQDFESDAPTCFLDVNSTPWFDLSSKSGREQAVMNLCGIMRWASTRLRLKLIFASKILGIGLVLMSEHGDNSLQV